MSDEISIRPARDRADAETCVLLQRKVWGLADLEMVSALQLVSSLHAGGLLHLAEQPNGEAVGFDWAYPALRNGQLQYHSELVAVVPGFQQRGLGARLKWALREEALRRGVLTITWTQDPLQARQANLNLRRLGASAAEFHENFYGITSSPLHHGLPTHRLFVRWDLRAERVEALSRAGEPPRVAPRPELPTIAEVEWQAGWPMPLEPNLTLEEPALLLEVPPEWDVLAQSAPRLAGLWIERVAAALRHYLARGYVADDFAPTDDEGRRRPMYVLRRV